MSQVVRLGEPEGGSLCVGQEGAVSAAHIQHFVKRGQCLQLTFSTLSRGGSVYSSHSALGPASHLKAECGGYA